MIKPITGANSKIRIQRTLATGPAPLLATLMMAQITMSSQINPKMPATSKPLRFLLQLNFHLYVASTHNVDGR